MVNGYMVNILCICSGNICRSPTMDGVLRALVKAQGLSDKVHIDSAGTHGFHEGEAPDSRAIKRAKKAGYDLSGLRARKMRRSDFDHFHLILCADEGHLHQVRRAAPSEYDGTIALFLDYAGHPSRREVPDPYYGSARDFDDVFTLVEEASRQVVARVKENYFGL